MRIFLSRKRPVKRNNDISWHHILEIFKERFNTDARFSSSCPRNCQTKVLLILVTNIPCSSLPSFLVSLESGPWEKGFSRGYPVPCIRNDVCSPKASFLLSRSEWATSHTPGPLRQGPEHPEQRLCLQERQDSHRTALGFRH